MEQRLCRSTSLIGQSSTTSTTNYVILLSMMKSDLSLTFSGSPSFQISSEEDLIQTFRPKDHDLVILPRPLTYPLNIQHYIAWGESSGNYTYLVFKRPNWELPRGLVFRRTPTQQTTSNLCDWCHSYGSTEDIGMLTVRINAELTVGQYLCVNLDCLEKLETQITSTGKNFDTLAEQVCQKIERFYERTIMAPKK